MLFTTCW